MRSLWVVVTLIALAGCVSPRQQTVATAPVVQAQEQVARWGTLLIMPLMPGILARYRAIDLDEPAFHVSDSLVEPCDQDRVALPVEGVIRDRKWQEIHSVDGGLIEDCARSFMLLRDSYLGTLGALRGW